MAAALTGRPLLLSTWIVKAVLTIRWLVPPRVSDIRRSEAEVFYDLASELTHVTSATFYSLEEIIKISTHSFEKKRVNGFGEIGK